MPYLARTPDQTATPVPNPMQPQAKLVAGSAARTANRTSNRTAMVDDRECARTPDAIPVASHPEVTGTGA